MKFLVMGKMKEGEAAAPPDPKAFEEMGKFNEELVKAGIVLSSEGLHPSAKGARVKFSGSQRTVIDGPFTESKELVAGFQIWQVRSKVEAIEWVKRSPNVMGGDTEVEIRQIMEAADFPEDYVPGMKDRRERLAAELERQQKA